MATAKKLTARQDFIRRVVTATDESKISKVQATTLAVELWNMRLESKRLATESLNRVLSNDEQVRDAELDVRVKAIGKELGLNAYRQDDSRGWTIRVEVPRELADNYDGLTTGCG